MYEIVWGHQTLSIFLGCDDITFIVYNYVLVSKPLSCAWNMLTLILYRTRVEDCNMQVSK